jgi:alpha-amylase/alpha-mannosidase (GH57 family)
MDHRLGACEGSDWFWWPGVHNPTPAVAQFDELFRAHLSALYRAIDLTPPKALSMPFASGVAHDVAAGGTMQRGS